MLSAQIVPFGRCGGSPVEGRLAACVTADPVSADSCIGLIGPGLGMAVARRFAVGGYRITLAARSTDRLGDLAGTLADTGAKINTIAADASDPDGLGARMRELYLGIGAQVSSSITPSWELQIGC